MTDAPGLRILVVEDDHGIGEPLTEALGRKLGPPDWITTLRGVGYRFDPPPDAGGVLVLGDGD
jgi:DNA-binding response OmpR family regulator